MADVLSIALTAGFFALAALLVRGCELLVGSDLEPAATEPVAGVRELVDA
jgi:hypothetical protein